LFGVEAVLANIVKKKNQLKKMFCLLIIFLQMVDEK
jgi:hypothetical protein